MIKYGAVSNSEQIIYKQCSIAASTPVLLAKCVAKLLDVKDNTLLYHQIDPPSAIEKLGELFFGKNLSKSVPKYLENEEPLRRIVPKYNTAQIREPNQDNPYAGDPRIKPIPVKEFYFTRNSHSFPKLESPSMLPLSVPSIRSRNNNYFYGSNNIQRRLKRELLKQQKGKY